MSRLDDLDRKMWSLLRRGRTPAEAHGVAARRWWAPLVAGTFLPVVVAVVVVALGLPLFSWQLVQLVVLWTIPMTFISGYFYAERRRQQDLPLPWWMDPGRRSD